MRSFSSGARRGRRARLLLSTIALCATGFAGALAAAPAHAASAFGIQNLTGGVFEADGSPSIVAGGHPQEGLVDLTFNWTGIDRFPDFPGFMMSPVPDGDPRDVSVDLPPGFVANPNAVPKCDEQIIQDASLLTLRCPPATQVGAAGTGITGFSAYFAGGQPNLTWSGVYNMVPPPGVTAQLAFNLGGAVTHIDARLRDDGTYGITAVVKDIAQADGVFQSKVILWGNPAHDSHDGWRGQCLSDGGPNGSLCPADATVAGQGGKAFLTNPMDCTVSPITTTVHTRGWQEPDRWVTGAFDTDVNGDPMRVEGCDELAFEPRFSARPDGSRSDAPTGLAVDLTFPQEGLTNPSGRAAPPLKRATVTLPEGMSINPAAAAGLEACSDEQLNYKVARPAACPEGAKIGTVTAETPLLDETIGGDVYVGSQLSDDPRSGSMFRLFLVFKSEERGLNIKLPGSVSVDPATGRIETTFDNNPQTPVSKISLRLKAGERAPLAMPSTCGPQRIDAELTSWAGQVVQRSDSFAVECGGSPFEPTFEAGSVDSTSGAFSPFAVRIARGDGQQFLSTVQVGMPEGLLAKLRGVELCPDAVAGDGTPGTCPAGSRIGTATVAAGSGRPFVLQGPVYLTGPYKGGPYGLSVQVHAKAGPFDLGMVKVRNALHVDPVTAQVTVASDPLPQIVKGVPVRLRSVNVDVDRPGFTLNPTSCSQKQVESRLTSIGGAVHESSSRFQVGDCAALGFKPRLAMRLLGKRQTWTGGHPALKAIVSQGSGQSNIGRAEVALPKSIVLDPNNSTDPKLVCGYDEGLKADCAASSVIGKATASTPLLNKPLTGKVYLVQGIRFGKSGNRIRTTPTLLVKLRGEVSIDLRAKTTVKKDRLVTIFPDVPDARVSKFSMKINGGKKGILVVTRTRKAKINVCNSKQIADVKTDGHNGKNADFRTRIKTPCKAKKAAKTRRKAAR